LKDERRSTLLSGNVSDFTFLIVSYRNLNKQVRTSNANAANPIIRKNMELLGVNTDVKFELFDTPGSNEFGVTILAEKVIDLYSRFVTMHNLY
jgi:hypothetical protein